MMEPVSAFLSVVIMMLALISNRIDDQKVKIGLAFDLVIAPIALWKMWCDMTSGFLVSSILTLVICAFVGISMAIRINKLGAGTKNNKITE